MNKLNRMWTPLTNEELDEMIKKSLQVNKHKEPRPLSLVKFADDSQFKAHILKEIKDNPNKGFSGRGSEFDNKYILSNLLYLGSISNQPGHGAYVNLKLNSIHVVDIDELVELTKDEL